MIHANSTPPSGRQGELIRPVNESLGQSHAIAVYTHHDSLDRHASRALLDWLREALEDNT